MHFHLTGIHNLFSKWNLDLRFKEHFTKISTQNFCYQKGEVMRKSYDPYPWLDEDDPRRDMMDEEILHRYIDLFESHLTHKEKEEVMDLIVAKKKAFSLRDEIGKCPGIKVNIEVNDPSNFFVRPFPIAEEDKPLMDKCMQKLVSLGILTKNSTTHTSLVMLVARKGNERKRPVVDFRLLSTRIVRRNTSTPLLRDIYIMLGRAQCKVLSCVDLKEAFHSLPLAPEAKEFCGILPYFGSPHYRYEVAFLMVRCTKHTLCRGLEYATACHIYVFLSRNDRYSPIKLHSTTGLLYNFVTNQRLPIEALELHTGCPWDSMCINWGEVTLTNEETKIRLPYNVKIPITEKSRLCNLMEGQDCTAHLMVLQGHTWYTVGTTPLHYLAVQEPFSPGSMNPLPSPSDDGTA